MTTTERLGLRRAKAGKLGVNRQKSQFGQCLVIPAKRDFLLEAAPEMAMLASGDSA
jgi:hypothetical protein